MPITVSTFAALTILRYSYKPVIVVLFLFLTTISAVSQQIAAKPLSATEQWVQSRVINGMNADLEQLPDKNSSRELSSSFIVQLLTNYDRDSKIQRNVIQIFNATITEPLILKSLDIQYGVKMSRCIFKGEVDFSRSTFSRSLSLSESVFDAPVNLSYVKINGTLDLDKSLFKHTGGVNCDSIKVGENISLQSSVFDGQLNLVNSEIKGNLQADHAQFNNEKETVYFTSMGVNHNCFLREATFNGPSRFIVTNIAGIFDLTGTHFNNTQTPPKFQSLRIGTIKLDRTQFAAKPLFDGLDYQTIFAGEKDEQSTPNEKLIQLPEKFQYNAAIYSQLEDFLRKSGNPEDADQLYINGKWRERQETLSGFSWLGNMLLYVLVGYGRRPWQALIYGIIVVLIGYYIFYDKEKMEALTRHYSPFWYSLDVFAPVINLGTADLWIPKQERRFARNYMYVQRILGWVLVPVGIVAWTGLIK